MPARNHASKHHVKGFIFLYPIKNPISKHGQKRCKLLSEILSAHALASMLTRQYACMYAHEAIWYGGSLSLMENYSF